MNVLMGPDHPEGWKLEELLDQLQGEIESKSHKINLDDRPQARQVLRNNQQIIGLLAQAEALQRSSYDILDAMAPNEGPLGNPRISNPGIYLGPCEVDECRNPRMRNSLHCGQHTPNNEGT